MSKFKALFNVENAPHGDTLNACFKNLNVEEIQEVMCRMVEALVRMKVLYSWRLLGQYYLISIDGTSIVSFSQRHCEHCLTRKLKNGETLYYHPVLEAKLVTTNGFCFSIMSEFIENKDLSSDKQDCELKAFYRLSKRLKKRFPRMPLVLLLDGLYACGPVFDICEAFGWKYIINLKDQDLPSVNTEFESLAKLVPENRACLRLQAGKKSVQQYYRFVNDLFYKDTNNHQHNLHVIECKEKLRTQQGKETITKYKWVTNIKPTKDQVCTIANNGGRSRWKIENEGFNTQKNGGFELEHPYSENENARKIFYLLLQIAHTICQLIEKGSLFKASFPKGVGNLKNIAQRQLEAWRNLQIKKEAFKNIGNGKCQIRFDTS